MFDPPPDFQPPPDLVVASSATAPAPIEDPTAPTAIRIGTSEPIGYGIRRICLDRFDNAIDGLTQSDERDQGVHSARKSMKRIRAMIRFARDQVGYEVYRNENVVLRDTARRIAPVRDSAVLVQTVDTVVARNRGGLKKHAFEEVQGALGERHERLAARVLDDRQLMGEVVTNLRVCRRRFSSWPVEAHLATQQRRVLPPGFEAVSGGIHRVYRRGRDRMNDAYRDRTTYAFHQWRKRVKYLRYQMEALEGLWPEVVGAYARSLDELGESLGLEHDLAMLEHTLLHDPGLCPNPKERRLLGALVLHERAVLRHSAAKLGKLIYAEDPDAFTMRIGTYWDAARAR